MLVKIYIKLPELIPNDFQKRPKSLPIPYLDIEGLSGQWFQTGLVTLQTN